MNDKALSLLGLARRAGKISLGFDPAVDSARTGQSRLILITSDISPKTKKELEFSLRESGTPIHSMPFDVKVLGNAVGKAAKIVSVNDEGFANSVIKLLGSNNGEE